MGQREFVAAHPVMGQQQPARAPLRDAVEAITHHMLSELVEQG
jgi:hypothetical protein